MTEQAGGAPIALYGAGRHTRWLIETLGIHTAGPPLIAILDDHPGTVTSIGGVPVLHPSQLDPAEASLIVTSSDSIEDLLARRAELWANRAQRAERPCIVRLYQSLPPGPYDASHEELFAQLADGVPIEAITNPYTCIQRLPAAPTLPTDLPLPIPPNGVRSGYDGSDEGYLASGQAIARTILDTVARHSPNDESPRDILDWGCSSGRILRHVPDLLPGSRCWGCDIDPWPINWAAAHLAPPLRLFRSTTAPSLPIESASFDLIYAISIFTHMSDHFDTWLMELRRILRPGGFLYASINDEHVWARCAADPAHPIAHLCPRLDFSKPLEDDFVSHGLGPHAQSFWHTRAVRRRWSFAFDILEITSGAIDGVQTGVLMRKPRST